MNHRLPNDAAVFVSATATSHWTRSRSFLMSSGADLLSSSVATSRSMAVFPRSSSFSACGLPHDDDDGRPYLPQKRRGPTAPLCAGRPAWSRMLTRYDAVAFSPSP